MWIQNQIYIVSQEIYIGFLEAKQKSVDNFE